jgi:hypothetical protein
MITGQAQFCPQPTGCAWMVITLAYEPTVQFFWREAWDESWSVWSSYWVHPWSVVGGRASPGFGGRVS